MNKGRIRVFNRVYPEENKPAITVNSHEMKALVHDHEKEEEEITKISQNIELSLIQEKHEPEFMKEENLTASILFPNGDFEEQEVSLNPVTKSLCIQNVKLNCYLPKSCKTVKKKVTYNKNKLDTWKWRRTVVAAIIFVIISVLLASYGIYAYRKTRK